MKAVVDLVVHTLGPVLYVLLFAGAALGLVVGIMLLVDAERLMRWNDTLNRWFSTRQALRPLEEPVDIKRVVYRRHRVIGVLVFAGALYTLDVLAFSYKTDALLVAFRGLGNPAVLGIVLESARIFLIIGNVAALGAALALCFRPSLLKGLEAWGDQQFSGRASSKPFDTMRYQPDDFVRARPRVVGVLVVIGSLYVLFGLSRILF